MITWYTFSFVSCMMPFLSNTESHRLSPKGCTRLGNPDVHLIINVYSTRKCTSKVSQLVNGQELSFIHKDSRHNVWFSRRSWYRTTVFFALIVRPKLLQAGEKWSMLACGSSFEPAARAQLQAKKSSRTATSFMQFWLVTSTDRRTYHLHRR